MTDTANQRVESPPLEAAAGNPIAWVTPRRLGASLLVLIVLVVAATVTFGFWGFSYDDAFITYRYARSWEASGSLEYNPGERVFGTTAPGYALLLGSLAKVTPGLDVPDWGTLLAVASLLALAWALARATQDKRDSLRDEALVGAPLAFALLALTLPANIALFGSEALPAAALVAAGALVLFEGSAEIAAGLLLAGAAALRLDAGLAACTLGVAYWIWKRRFPWRLAVTGGSGVAMYLGFVTATFGRVVPHTLAIKQSELPLSAQRSYGLAEWAWLRSSMSTGALIFLIALAVVGFLALARYRLLLRPPLLALLVWVAGIEVAYRLFHVPFAPWYAVDLVLALAALAAVGVAWLAHVIAGLLSPRSTFRRRAATVIVAVLVLSPLLFSNTRWIGRTWRHPPDPRWEIYHRVGVWLRAHSRADDAVASIEVGFLGYSSRRPVLDLLGLVSPGVLASRRQGTLGKLVARRAPRFILDSEWLRPLGLGKILADPSIARRYAMVTTMTDASGRTIRVLERKMGGRISGKGALGEASERGQNRTRHKIDSTKRLP